MNPETFLIAFMTCELLFIGYIFFHIAILGLRVFRAWRESKELDKLLATPEGKKRYEEAVISLWKKNGRIDVDIKILRKDLL